MASAQEPGQVEFWVRNPQGQESLLYGSHTAALGPSGSADGAIASTPEKWLYIPRDSKLVPVNSRIFIRVTLATADGIDWSDCGTVIPITKLSGAVTNLQNSDFTGTDLVAATTAGVAHTLAYMDVKEAFYFGGGKIFFSLEDDT